MVKSCCAYNCTERANGSNFISFHRFPKHPELRKKWIIATKREDFIPIENTRIYGKHFLESDFIIHFGFSARGSKTLYAARLQLAFTGAHRITELAPTSLALQTFRLARKG
ncbi:hypothetical protein Zmor_015650 [Zophobas morio]|uniref:THAP-type domain-containing protein n=1 Tax=Zophobas morio TaxID=2755281 RepID=A0AA38IJT3_9CUCU|nr:hypothetical protein Zmor_015650 [Zophobas morio]